MRQTRTIHTYYMIPLMVVLIGWESGSCRNGKDQRASEEKMGHLPTSVWGGDHIRLQVSGDGAEVEYDCAHGSIKQPIAISGHRHFDVKGSYVREHSGPVRREEEAGGQSARYTGNVNGQTMALTVALADTAEEIGTFTLTLGNEGIIYKCR